MQRNDRYWGCCPECGLGASYFLNVGRDHWMVCKEDKTCWWVGANLFSAWREESEETWQRNAERLETYRQVEPLQEVSPRTTRSFGTTGMPSCN